MKRRPLIALSSRRNILRIASPLLSIVACTVVSGCADTKSASQGSDNGILREPDRGHEIHGEVGAAYGHHG
jgi:hypothetical protein